jgi:lysophospholipase L1-like esterase
VPAPTQRYLPSGPSLPWLVRGIFALEVVSAACACGGAPHASTTTAGKGGPSGTTAEAAMRLVGRFDRSDPAKPRFAWSASTIEVRFRGAGLVVGLRVAPIAGSGETTLPYGVDVDGVARSLDVRAGAARYTIASGLDRARVHTARITREAEAFAGVHQVLGIEAIDGELLAPDKRDRPLVELVGDSITCGYGALGEDSHCHFSFSTERATASYAILVGRALDVDVTTVCWSGRGVIRNYDGDPEPRMPELFETVLPEQKLRWDFASTPMPAAVVVSLGTNDWFSDGDHDGKPDPLDVPAFEAGYVRFLERVRALRPRAPILVVTSPMVEGPMGIAMRASLGRVVEHAQAQRKSAGEASVRLVTLSEQGRDVGCDAHPNAAKHRVLARELESALRSVLAR